MGQPFEIYNFPKTAFTATFVGTLNMHEATVTDATAGRVRLAGNIFTVPAAALGDHRTGDTVKVALRPELLYIHPVGAAVENTLTGVVENVAFLGAVARIHLKVGDTTILVDEFNNPQLSVPAVGSTLTTYFTPESCMVLG